MLSIVLYGRNDNYGYNLHKRAALSLNCMAEVLSDADDEILFVDYNTPDDFPTFPEAIADTLTEKAKRHLRVLRVRPSVVARFASRTHLVALEPVARNVAVRRSNPANRWILSTNTDMIFVPRKVQSLSEIVCELPKGYYGIPRFEVPEALWESLDRRDAIGVIEAIGRWGWKFHLNEVVTGMKPFLFDGPGDFQLIDRGDLFALNGFDEEMLLGWHVDANIAKRLSVIHGDAGDLSEHLFGYHCDHTRQVTPAHKSNAVENDSGRFFHDLTQADLPEQAESWGCAGYEIEEVKLTSLSNNVYLKSLERLPQKPLAAPTYSAYVPESYNRCDYSPPHVVPFLLDIFASTPRNWQVAWLGAPGPMLSLFIEGWRSLGFTTPILIHRTLSDGIGDAGSPDVHLCSYGEIADNAHAFIFDFSRGDGTAFKNSKATDQTAVRGLIDAVQTLTYAEEDRLGKGRVARRFIGINAIHNQFERLFATHINCAKTPFSVRIRHGFLIKSDGSSAVGATAEEMADLTVRLDASGEPVAIASEVEDLLEKLQLGPAGLKRGDGIVASPRKAGLVAQTIPLLLQNGQFRLEVECQSASAKEGSVSGFDLWLIDTVARVRRLLGYPLERRLRRAVSRVLGTVLSEHVKAFLTGRLTPKDHSSRKDRFATPILQVEVHQGDEILARMRAMGSDITTLNHVLRFDLTNRPGGGGTIILSFASNGGDSFGFSRVRLTNVKEPTWSDSKQETARYNGTANAA